MWTTEPSQCQHVLFWRVQSGDEVKNGNQKQVPVRCSEYVAELEAFVRNKAIEVGVDPLLALNSLRKGDAVLHPHRLGDYADETHMMEYVVGKPGVCRQCGDSADNESIAQACPAESHSWHIMTNGLLICLACATTGTSEEARAECTGSTSSNIIEYHLTHELAWGADLGLCMKCGVLTGTSEILDPCVPPAPTPRPPAPPIFDLLPDPVIPTIEGPA